MITEKKVLSLADDFWLKLQKCDYKLSGVHFIAGNDGKYAASSRWAVCYEKPQPDDSVVDGGDYRIVLIVDAATGEVKLAE